MATSKLLKPTNVTISIPEFTDQPDQRVNSNCIDKEADAINALNDQIATLNGKITSAIQTRVVSSTKSVDIAASDYDTISFDIPSISNYTPVLFMYSGTASSALAPTNGIGQFVYSSPRSVIVKNVTSSAVSGSITFSAIVLYVKTNIWGGNA